MPKKSAAKNAFRSELEEIALAAYVQAKKKVAAFKRQKEAAKEAMRKARNLRRIVDAMSTPPVGEDGGAGFRRSHFTHTEWPWREALMRRKMTPADYARKQVSPPLGVETAKGWLKVEATRPRPIPEFWARKISMDFLDAKGRTEVPLVDSSWPHGIRRG